MVNNNNDAIATQTIVHYWKNGNIQLYYGIFNQCNTFNRPDGTLKYREYYKHSTLTRFYYDKTGSKVVAEVVRDRDGVVIANKITSGWH
jgi:hypothetical protein